MPGSEVTRIQLCGPFALVAGAKRLEASLPGRLGRSLVAYLAQHRRRAVPRDELLDALWGEAVTSASAATLTVLLSKSRAAIGADTIRGRGMLQLHLPEGALVDTEVATASLHDAESACSLRQWQRAWGPALTAHFIARRTFLLGNHAQWIDEERIRLELADQRALACYARACLGLGGTELPGAERGARALIGLAPTSETGHRLLIEALAAQGDTASAINAYEDLRQTLADELGIAPGPESRALYSTLLNEGGPPGSP